MSQTEKAQTQDMPSWVPSEEKRKNSHIHKFAEQARQNPDNYHELWQWSLNEMGEFWSKFWDYAEVIGDKGSIALTDEDKMPGAQFFPRAA